VKKISERVIFLLTVCLWSVECAPLLTGTEIEVLVRLAGVEMKRELAAKTFENVLTGLVKSVEFAARSERANVL
jgi:hypothetical protein